MRRYQGFEVYHYVFTLDALPLKPSRFFNDGVHDVADGRTSGRERPVTGYDA